MGMAKEVPVKDKPKVEKKEEVKVDVKVAEEKAIKGEKISKEEEVAILKEQPAPEGFKGEILKKETEEAIKDDGKKEEVQEKKVEEKPKEEPKDKISEPAKVEKPKDNDDYFVRLETELAKPEGQEDLSNWSNREKAYFHQMRRDRRSRQQAEEERDAALFRETKNKEKKEEPKEEEDPIEELKKKDPTDFLTVADVLKMTEKAKAKQLKNQPKDAPKADPIRAKYLEYCDKEAKANHPDDYEAVMELTDDILPKNAKYAEALAVEMLKGGNVAEKAYELIKADPEFAKLYPVAETRVLARNKAKKPVEEKKEVVKSPEEIRKEEEARIAQEALEKNNDKPKTTGHAGANEDRLPGELTMDDIGQMSDREFAKLPKRTRDMYLKRFG